jgi:MoxR-like ATPase
MHDPLFDPLLDPLFDPLNDPSNPVVLNSMTAPTIAARGPLIPHERAELLEVAARLRAEVAGRIVGQEKVLDEILMALLAGGHALLVGVPGLAKTLMIRSVSEAMRLGFRRIQFTPDLVPSDITGTEVMEEDATSHSRLFRFVQGPIFANIVLADEINRAPPRTQAALLEAMQEHSVTVAGETMLLPAPFFVLATQNPIEQEGTYPLPEAQLDRFLFDIRVSYPDEDAEVAILRNTTGREYAPLDAVIDATQTIALQRMVRDVPAADVILQYVARLVRATRPDESSSIPAVRQFVRWGAGPRAGQALVLGAKANALLAGRNAVTPADIKRVAHPVLRHRILLNFAAEAEGLSAERIVDDLLEHVPTPKSDIRV